MQSMVNVNTGTGSLTLGSCLTVPVSHRTLHACPPARKNPTQYTVFLWSDAWQLFEGGVYLKKCSSKLLHEFYVTTQDSFHALGCHGYRWMNNHAVCDHHCYLINCRVHFWVVFEQTNTWNLEHMQPLVKDKPWISDGAQKYKTLNTLDCSYHDHCRSWVVTECIKSIILQRVLSGLH